jgi:exodeoxyribonuclease VIII
MVDIVIDIETLGTRPGCVILEVGACAIDPRAGEITANFSRRLDEFFTRGLEPPTADAAGTIAWWLGPETIDTYRALLQRGLPGVAAPDPRNPRGPLDEFRDWTLDQTAGHDPGQIRVWGNGPQFDLVILQSAFDRYGVECPWHYRQERCARTALELAGCERGSVPWAERGPRHRALNDARHEARKLFYSGALGEVSAILRRRYDVKARQA